MLNFIFNNTPFHLMTKSLQSGEALSYVISSGSIGQIINTASQQFTPPFYFVLLRVWSSIFGISEISMRSLSFIIFIASAYVFYELLKRVFSIKSRFLYVYLTLFLLNPFLLYYGLEAQMQSLLIFLTILSFYLFLTKNNTKNMISIIFGLYTSVLFVVVIGIQVVYRYLTNKKTNIKRVVLEYKIPIIVFIPWGIYSIDKFAGWPLFTSMKINVLRSLTTTLGILYTGYNLTWGFYDAILPALSLILIGVLLYFIYKYPAIKLKKDKNLILLILWAFVLPAAAIVLTAFTGLLTLPQVTIISSIGFLILLFYVAERLSSRERLILITVLFMFTIHYHFFLARSDGHENIKAAIQDIRAISSEEDLVYVYSPSMFFTATYYYDKERVFVYGDKKDKEKGVNLIIPDDKYVSILPFYPSKAFLLKKNGSYEAVALF